jgi:aminomethyltransferase
MAVTLQSAVIPTSNPDSAAQLSALLHGTGVAPLNGTGWIRVTGSDRVRWLNGMVSNFTQQLAPGEGCYNFVLNAQGRIQGDLTAFAEADAYLLETSREQVPALMAHLDRFIIMDDVELADISDTRHGLLIAGPDAPTHLKNNGVEVEPLHLARVRWRNAWLEVVHAYSPLIPRYEVWSDPETISALSGTLTAIGATSVSPEALEHLRLLEGTPRYGVDIRDKDLPQETAQSRALHFAKGCYLGQEIVERIRSRGNVHRTFTGFTLTGTLPQGAALQAEGKAVGELTSFAAIQLPEPLQLALGYVRREALDRGHPLEYPGGVATPIALPYPIS